MIHYVSGNIFDSKAEALVNTVNTEGVMGKGIALQFKKFFPLNYKIYVKACKNNELQVGNMLAVKDRSLLFGEKLIVNFPTKKTWRKPSEYLYIEEGLKDLIRVIELNELKSIAIPPLGAGNGGLDWGKVKKIIEKSLFNINCEIFIYEPAVQISEPVKKERVTLTPARAMLLAVLYELVRNGEFVSEFASEKAAYFLQKFGATGVMKLDFQKSFYGPYSGKVKHVLYYLNGSYLTGYGSKDAKPFEDLSLLMETEAEVLGFLSEPINKPFLDAVNKTKVFLSGYFSNFGLELLSTIDFIARQIGTFDENTIRHEIEQWSDRKKNLFAHPMFISKAIAKLEEYELSMNA